MTVTRPATTRIEQGPAQVDAVHKAAMATATAEVEALLAAGAQRLATVSLGPRQGGWAPWLVPGWRMGWLIVYAD